MYIGLVPPYRVPEGTQTFYNFVLGQILTPIIVMISTSAYRGWQSSVPGFAQSMARRGSLVPQALRQCLRETANLTSLYAAWVHSPAAGRNRPGLEVLTHQNCHGRTCRSWEWTVHVETLTIIDYSVADIGFHKGWFYNMPRSQHPVRFCTHNSDNDADRTDYFTFGTCAQDNATIAQIIVYYSLYLQSQWRRFSTAPWYWAGMATMTDHQTPHQCSLHKINSQDQLGRW